MANSIFNPDRSSFLLNKRSLVMKKVLALVLIMVVLASFTASFAQEVTMGRLPKALGNTLCDQAHEGAMEAHEELENPGELIFTAPDADNAIPRQIEIIESSTTQRVGAIMISANDYEQLVPSTTAAMEEDITVVTWDSPVSPEGEELFIAQVDFSEVGMVMAD